MANTYDIIHAWYEESEGGGLPEITEEDEGKVLTVDEGEAVWAENKGTFTVDITWELSGEDENVTEIALMNKTWIEIKNAIDAGNIVVIYLRGDFETLAGFICGAYDNSEDEGADHNYEVNVMYFDAMGNYEQFYCDSEDDYPYFEEE